jgi:(4S)-4-hydroxy-5-phosphonooxypentane-2,3-dione isomerase
MHVVQVFVKVKPGCDDEFLAVTRDNAAQSRKEPGVVRFDLLVNKEQPHSYTLWEVYRSPAEVDAHKQTMHYRRWVQAMETLLAESRTRTFWENLDPDGEDYR